MRSVLCLLKIGVMATAWLSLSALPVQAQTWLRAESPHFIVYSTGTEASVRDYTLMLEDFDAVLRAVHGHLPDPPGVRRLPVFLVGSNGQLREMYPKAGPNLDGFQAAGEEDIFAASVRNGAAEMGDSNKGDDVVLHEYVHHFLVQNFPGAYPAWLNEGYAEYLMTADLQDRIVIGNFNNTRASWLVEAPWIPLATVVSKSTETLKPSEQGPYYAEAWLLTHYLMSDLERRKQLADYLHRMRGGMDAMAAWRAVFGDPAAMEGKLRVYVTTRLTGSVWQRDWKPAEVKVTALSAGAGAVLLRAQSLNFELQGADAARTLKALREAGAKYPTDPAAQVALGQAETTLGDHEAGRAMLEKLVAADPRDTKALRVLAQYHMAIADAEPAKRQTEMREAGRLLGIAAKVDPESYQTLYRYAQTRKGEPDYPSENTYNVLLKAVSLAPQVSDVRIAAAEAAMLRKDTEIARALLIPVVNSPHPGENTDKARAMLKTLPPPSAATPPAAAASPARQGF